MVDKHVNQYLRQFRTSEDSTKSVYAGVINQKLKLFKRGKCHIWGTDLRMERTNCTKPPINTALQRKKIINKCMVPLLFTL